MKLKNIVIIVLAFLLIVFLSIKITRSSKMELDVSSRFSFSPDGEFLLFDAIKGWALNIDLGDFGMFFHPGKRDIYLLNLSDSHIKRLTYTGNNSGPVFSPDGTKIAFISNRAGNDEIYIMDSDGQNVKRLTKNNFSDYPPSFSPDGAKLVFMRKIGGVRHVLLFDITSGKEHDIQEIQDNPYYVNPWFFDGSTIFFEMGADGHILYLSQPKLAEKFIYRGGVGEYPVYSPDRVRTALARYQGQNKKGEVINEIFVTDSKGENAIQITHNGLCNRMGAFLPDGRSLIFMAGAPKLSSGLELWQVNIDGSNLRRIRFKQP